MVEMSPEAYLAIGFPLLTAVILAAFFPISLKDYFVPGEIQKLSQGGLTPYRLKTKDYLLVFVLYTISAVFLSVVQGYLLWGPAKQTDAGFIVRYTNFYMYPVFPSALMAVLLMLFLLSYKYVRRGEDDVRKFLLRTYDGWPLHKEIPRYKPVVLAAGLICSVANFWIYNIYIEVTDDGIIYSARTELEQDRVWYDDIDYLSLMQEADGDEAERSYMLVIWTKDRKYHNTKRALFYGRDVLFDMDDIIKAAEKEDGGYVDVFVMKKSENDGWKVPRTLDELNTEKKESKR
jgi:hypothetical protein